MALIPEVASIARANVTLIFNHFTEDMIQLRLLAIRLSLIIRMPLHFVLIGAACEFKLQFRSGHFIFIRCSIFFSVHLS